MILRSRVVLPISGPPINDGALIIRGNHIAAIGRWRDLVSSFPSEPLMELEDSIVLPGLINAHCHLDYTDMAGCLNASSFPDWVKGIIAHKSSWSYTDYAQSWLHGAKMLVESGTTTVANIEAVPELLPDVWSATPLRVASFLELTCVKNRERSDDILREAIERVYALKPARGFLSLSPHALYSTLPHFLEGISEICRKEQWRTTMHVSESPEEFAMYNEQAGSLFDWLKKQRDMSDCGQGTPVSQLQRCGLLDENLLAVHANYLKPQDIQLLAQARASVAHCPRSHRFFSYDPFPYQKLADAGVNICLGTDSLASVHRTRGAKPELSLFAEMEQFMSANPSVPPSEVLKMVTINGARSLGMHGKIGELSKGSYADLIAIPFSGKTSEACDAVVNNWGNVKASLIHGEWAVAPH